MPRITTVLLSTFLATAASQYGAARVDSTSADVFINIGSLIGATLDINLFGDPVGGLVLLGGMLIVLDSIVVVRGERFNAGHVEDATHGLSMG